MRSTSWRFRFETSGELPSGIQEPGVSFQQEDHQLAIAKRSDRGVGLGGRESNGCANRLPTEIITPAGAAGGFDEKLLCGTETHMFHTFVVFRRQYRRRYLFAGANAVLANPDRFAHGRKA
jgi:hypothetical protein